MVGWPRGSRKGEKDWLTGRNGGGIGRNTAAATMQAKCSCVEVFKVS